ncbi:hypothetical protein DRJ04_06635 [Candidatus Aerophobetes bacterium]|uniref:Uncharacterized protein n=1 Tax=Aerophobetes bacterium TaxID=2030807 RepID=A0A662DDD4_UNCAE|nr:MAG: hypothetical protein DRJ04_06635 [Candidatus Aerophobetes bacterium]
MIPAMKDYKEKNGDAYKEGEFCIACSLRYTATENVNKKYQKNHGEKKKKNHLLCWVRIGVYETLTF